MQEIFEKENSELVLSNIFVYPIKSCGRFEVTEWDITSNGLNYDREWVLVDDNGTYLNQKKVRKFQENSNFFLVSQNVTHKTYHRNTLEFNVY
jgi:uncharacterized protein YcbX